MTRAIGSTVTMGAWSIGQALRECRGRAGMTVRHVAHKVKATPRDVDAWEREDALPPLASFNRLFAIFPAFRGMIGEAGIRLVHAASEDTGPTPGLGEILRVQNSPEKVPHYTTKLREEVARAGLTIRGPKGLLVLTGLPFERVCALLQGSKPSNAEHAALVRALPRMRPHDRLRLGFLTPAPTDPPAVQAAADPVPPPLRPEPEIPARAGDAAPPPRGAAGPDAPPARAGDTIHVKGSVDPRLPDGPYVLEAVPVPSHPALTLAPRTFGEALRAARAAEATDPETIGPLLGVHANTVRAWERDAYRPIAEHLDRLIELFPRLAPFRPKRAVERRKAPGKAALAAPDPVPHPPDADAFVAFGVALAELREAIAVGMGQKAAAEAALAAVDAGLGAGLSAASALAAIRKRM